MTEDQASQLPPPPAGYTLDPSPSQSTAASQLPPPPAGYTLDAPSTTANDPRFSTASLGPNFVPDYSIDVYGTALPSGPSPYPGDPRGPSIPMYNYPPGSTQLQPMTVQDRPLSGWENAVVKPLDYLGEGMQQTGQGLAGLQHPQSLRQVAGATSDLIRGGMTIATPIMAPEFLAAPKAAIGGMLTYGAAQQGIEFAATHLGLPKEYAKLAGDIGGLFGGHRMYSWLSDMARIPDQRAANAIYQKLEAYMAALQDPTLDANQKAASKAAADALIASLRAEEGWKLPALFPNPNQLEKDAYKYMRGIGVPPNAGAGTGSPFVRGAQWLSGMTPAGGVMDVGIKRQTVEALRGRAAGLLSEAAPAEGPAREFYSQVEDAVNKSTPVNVPLRVDKDGSQISGDVKAPVDLRDLKYDLEPLWQKLQFLPMKDQSVSHAFSALKVLTNGPDHIDPLTAEVALSQFKKAALGEPGGIEGALTKTVIPKLQGAIDSSVKEYAGDDALTALQTGRRAAAKEFGAEWLNDQFTLAQQEGGFGHGRQLWNNWNRLTDSAKTTMFNPAQVAELNKFFHGVRMIEENPNPSGTALAGAIMAQAGYAMHGGIVDPLFYLGQLGATGIAKLLRSDLGVKLLSEGITIPRTSARGRFVEQQLKDILSRGPSGGGAAGGGPPPEEPPPPPPPGGGTPPAAPSGGGAAGGTGLGQIGEMGQAITGNMYKMLWDKVQKGDVTEAGAPSALLQAAKAVRDRGGMQTIDDLRALANDYAKMPRDTLIRERVRDLIDKHSPPAAGGGAARTPATTMSISGVTPTRLTKLEDVEGPGGGGAAAEPPESAEPESLGRRLMEGAKRFLTEEEGSLTLRNLRKADRAAGSEQSTRVPRAVKSTEDPLSNILTTGMESWSRDPEMMRKNVNAMLDYPNFHDLRPQVKNGSLSIPDAAERMIGRIQDNLQWLHDSMPENFRDRARLWYDGAHKIARKWAGDYGATPEQVAGSMAVTSPGTDWFVNAERARRLLEFWQDRGSKTWDPRMETTWRDKVSKAVPDQARGQIYKLIKGKSFNQVANDPEIAPIWFRLYDEAVNPREYPTLTPEGKAGDLARIGSGDPRQFSWSDFGQIGKVLSILEDGSKENIHKNLGQEHKVRNFYNNIINPDSPREHTTIDTHAVAAGLMRPLSQMSTEVGHNFGGLGSSSSSISGESGTYALHKEAYRRAAAANGLLPREMQSITWEAIRSMFSPQFKRNPANVEYVNSLWRDVSSGKITADAARQRALQYGGGFDRPAWFKGRWNPATPKAARPSSKPR